MKFLLFLTFMVAHSFSFSKELSVAISSVPGNLNPFFSTDANSQNIGRLIHGSLTDFDSSMKFYCVLCKTFQQKIIEGKEILEFELKNDIYFWDGSLITPMDVKRSVEYFSMESENLKSIFRFAFQKIKKVEILDNKKIRFYFDEYNPSHLADLSLLKIIKINPDVLKTRKVEIEDIVGAGLYKLGKTTPFSVEILKVKNPKEKIVFKIVKDETTLALKLIRGEIDLSVAGMSSRKIDWLKNKHGDKFNFYQSSGTNYYYMAFNLKKEKLQSEKVRRAIYHAIPIDDLIKYKLNGMGLKANSFLSPAFKNFYQDLKVPNFDLEESKKLLQGSGLKKNKNGFYLNLDWKISNNKAAIERANVIRDYLKKVGINSTLTIQEWGTFRKSQKQGNFDVFMGRWIGFTDPGILNFVFNSKNVPPNGVNRGHYKNIEFDKTIEKAMSTPDLVTMQKYVTKALKIINQDLPYIHFWHPDIVWIGKKCIGNLNVWPNGNYWPLTEIKHNCN